MKALNLEGTEKQVSYSKRLVEEELASLNEWISKCEKRGIETLKDRQVERYNDAKLLLDAFEHTKIVNAGTMIGLINNYNGGGLTITEFAKQIK